MPHDPLTVSARRQTFIKAISYYDGDRFTAAGPSPSIPIIMALWGFFQHSVLSETG